MSPIYRYILTDTSEELKDYKFVSSSNFLNLFCSDIHSLRDLNSIFFISDLNK